MKILIVCQHFYPEQFRVNDIAYELANRNNDITVLTGTPNYPTGKIYKGYNFKKKKEYKNNVKIIRTSIPGRGETRFSIFMNYLLFALLGSFKALFMKKDFDLVYVFQISPITMVWPAIIVKALKNIPLIIHCLDQWPISMTAGGLSKDSKIYKIIRKLSILTYNEASLITISSKSFKDYFENELNITSSKKGLIYWPSYAEDCYKNISYENNDTFDIVFAGNIGPAQSVETLIKAANILKKNKKIKFHIVGDGLNKSNCEKLAKSYSLDNVAFYGFYPVEEMPRFYSKADAFVITMLDNEIVNSTLPAKLQSYMASKKPIVGAVSGEAKKIIEDADCGVCCESLDYKNLAEIIKRLTLNTNNLKKMGENGYNYYKKYFDKDKCINKLINVFKNTLKIKDKFEQTTLIKFIKFGFSGGLCMLLDLIMFSIFNYGFFQNLDMQNSIFISTILARIISSFANFLINRNIVFAKGNSKSIMKYYLLAIIQMITSGLIVQSLSNLTNIFALLIKIITDIIIFIINYFIQNKWVFNRKVK